MLLTLFSAGQVLIPVIAIIFSMSIPIVAIIFYYKHKSRIMDERRLMIEKGLAPPELSKQMSADHKKDSPMSKGIDMLAVALGIVNWLFGFRKLGYEYTDKHDLRHIIYAWASQYY